METPLKRRELIRFQVQGELVGKQRPKGMIMGGHVHIYTQNKTTSYEALIREAYMKAAGLQDASQARPTNNPVEVNLIAFKALNKGDYGKTGPNKHGRLKLANIEMCTSKPDGDNLYKCVTDALNGLCYTDDSHIVEHHVEKHWGYSSYVEVIVWEYAEEDRTCTG